MKPSFISFFSKSEDLFNIHFLYIFLLYRLKTVTTDFRAFWTDGYYTADLSFIWETKKVTNPDPQYKAGEPNSPGDQCIEIHIDGYNDHGCHVLRTPLCEIHDGK